MVRASVNLHIERVPFDKDFWEVTVLRLQAFFFSAACILSELAVSRLHKGGIREPSECLKDMDQKTEEL